MDNSYVSKEIIHIKHKEHQIIPENQDLLFLIESKQVVCTKCYKDHYHNQTSMKFNDKGACQNLSCTGEDRNKYKLMVTYEDKDSEEIKTECFGCINHKFIEIIRVTREKPEADHKCTETGSKPQWGLLLNQILDSEFASLEKKETNRFTPKQTLSGLSLYFERASCNLPTSFEFSAENNNILAFESAMNVIIESEIPWISSSPKFLYMIRKQTRKVIINKLRTRFFSLFDNKDKITTYLFYLINENISFKLANYISLVLDEESQIKALVRLHKTNENSRFTYLKSETLFAQVLDTLEEHDDLAAKYKEEIGFMITDGLAKKTIITLEIAKLKVFDEISELLPNYDLQSEVRNESELIDISNILHFQLKQLIYGDTQIKDAISRFEETLSTLKRLLCITGSTETSDCNSSLTPNQKARLFYNTPVVNALLMTTQVLLKEFYKALVIREHFPKLEEVVSEAFSIMFGLAKDCYDISLLCFTNFQTLLLAVTTSESLRNKFEELFSYVSKYLFDLSDHPGYKEELLRFHDRILDNFACCYEEIKTNNCSRLNYVEIFLSIVNSEDNARDEFKEIQVSKKFILDFFILPLINFHHCSKEKLVSFESKILNDKLMNEVRFNQISDNQLFENHLKIMLATYFLLYDQKFQVDSEFFETLNLVVNYNKKSKFVLELEMPSTITQMTFRIKRKLTKTKSEILEKYSSIALEIIENEPNLASKIKVFSLFQSVMTYFQEEISFYELKVENILDSVYLMVKQSDRVEIKEDPYFEQRQRLKHMRENNEHWEKIQDLQYILDRNDKKLLRTKEDLIEITSNLFAGNKLVFNSKKEIKHWLQSLNKNLFSKLEDNRKIEEFKTNPITHLLKYKTKVNAKKCFNNLLNLDNQELESLLINFDFLINLVSKNQPFRIGPLDIIGKASNIGSMLVYFFIQFSISVKENAYIEVKNLYFNLLNKALVLLRVLVDGNNMRMRHLLMMERVQINSQIAFEEIFSFYEENRKTTILEILVSLCKFLLTSNDHYAAEIEIYHKIVFDILELISEIIEGNYKFQINSCLSWFSEYIRGAYSWDKMVGMKIEDFYIKICFDQTVNEEDKDKISKRLNNVTLLGRMMKVKEIDFVKQILEDQKENKTERLLKEYYSDSDNSNKIKASFRIFLYLRLIVDFDFKINFENENDFCLIEFLDQITKKVEVNIDGKLCEIRFLDAPDSVFLTKENEKVYFEKVDRSSIITKNQDLINYSVHFRDEINLKKKMKDNLWQRIGNKIESKWLLLVCLGLCLVGIYIMFGYTDVASKKLKDSVKTTFLGLLILQLVCCLGALLLWGSINFKLIYSLTLMQFRTANNIDKGQESKTNKLICRLNAIASSLEPTCSALILVTNILAISSSSLYWAISLQLLCFIAFSKNLLNIVKAIQMRSKQLGLITVFLVFVLLIYGIITFNYMSEYFQTEDGDPLCITLGHCLTSQIDFGFRMGGGMGDNMPVQEWQSEFFWRKFAYSTVHFVLFPVIMLNIVAGVIIDTFADLREQAAALEEDIKTICVICGGNRADISKEEGSYKKHIEEKHNIRSYMLFIKYILDKPEMDLEYAETLVKKQIENKEIDWLPSRDESVETQIKSLKEEIRYQIKNINERMVKQIFELNQRIDTRLDALNYKIDNIMVSFNRESTGKALDIEGKELNEQRDQLDQDFKSEIAKIEETSIRFLKHIYAEIKFYDSGLVEQFSLKRLEVENRNKEIRTNLSDYYNQSASNFLFQRELKFCRYIFKIILEIVESGIDNEVIS